MSPAKFGQHFLVDEGAIQKIVDVLNFEKADPVLEIGPGRAALTERMIKQGVALTAVEIDATLAAILRKRFQESPNFNLVNKDILEFDLSELKVEAGKKFKVIGNLPYSLTSPILRKLSNWDGWSEASVMVQKEVGDRLCASPGTKDYGALTVGVSLTSVVSHVFDLPPQFFQPPPRIHSSVVKLVRREVPLTPHILDVQKIIQAAFQQRRKTLLNSLSHGLGLEKVDVSKCLADTGIVESLRAERLSVGDFVKLGDTFRKHLS